MANFLRQRFCSLNSLNATPFNWLFKTVQKKKEPSTQRAPSFLCSDVAWPQLSVCNPACLEVVPVSATFVTGVSTVVLRCLFLMLIYGLSILDRERGSLGVRGVGGRVQETIDKTPAEHRRQLTG